MIRGTKALWSEINVRSARDLALLIERITPLDVDDFVAACAVSWRDCRSLFTRAELAASCLEARVDSPFESVSTALVHAAGPERTGGGYGPRSNYRYLVLTRYVSLFGIDDFEVSMATLQALTRRFTAEFDVRPFLERYPDRTVELLADWTSHPDHHVRRLVSEGTRPRLPWARHLSGLKDDPSPILPLLESLKDDRSRYVQRSVANSVADILKDNPDVAYGMLERWRPGARDGRQWVIRHSLRRLARKGEQRALKLIS